MQGFPPRTPGLTSIRVCHSTAEFYTQFSTALAIRASGLNYARFIPDVGVRTVLQKPLDNPKAVRPNCGAESGAMCRINVVDVASRGHALLE